MATDCALQQAQHTAGQLTTQGPKQTSSKETAAASSNWLHQMTLYLWDPDTAQGRCDLPHWTAEPGGAEASGSPPTGKPSRLPYLQT